MAKRDDAQDTLLALNTSLNAMNMGANLNQQQELALHKKHIQALWRHIERLEKFIKATPDGLQLKADRSEILLLKNGGIIIDGTRIHLKVPKNDQLMTSSGTMKA
jgi:hypothetical protein